MYIAVDLKVIEGLAASVARATGSHEDAILAGLARLWHRCWTTGSDQLTTGQLAGLFSGPNPIAALLEFGFLESMPDGSFRVRGAARYLRLKESRRAGAAATNAARSKSAPKRRSRATLSDAQATLNDALPPSTEHRDIKIPANKSPAHPEFQTTVDRLVATFEKIRGSKYAFLGGRDGIAVKTLLHFGTPDDVVSRWDAALRNEEFPRVDTLGDLMSHWNRFSEPTEKPITVRL